MFRRKKEPTKLDEAIAEIFSDMAGFTSDADEYSKMADQLTKLYALKAIEKPDRRVSPDTRATVIANLIGIGVIVGHERINVITSKALQFVQKLH